MPNSHSEPSSLRKHRLPVTLPLIKSRRPTFYDEIIIAPDFVDITATEHTQNGQPPPS